MKCLALDASTDFLSVAISNGRETWSFHQHVGQSHSDHVLPVISDLLHQSALALTDVEAIIFGQGPGSFTGLRIACGIAQGLAFSAGIEVIGIPTLDSMAAQLPDTQVLVCLNARMGQLYYAAYDTAHWQRLDTIQVIYPAEIAIPHLGPWLGAGDGFAVYADSIPLAVSSAITTYYPTIRPHAATMIELANTQHYPSCLPREAELLYIRDKIALTLREQQLVTKE